MANESYLKFGDFNGMKNKYFHNHQKKNGLAE